MSYIQLQSLQSRSSGALAVLDSLFGGVVQLPSSAFRTLLVWQRRAATRHHLAALDDRLLRDMGMTRADVEREAAIPIWRAS